MNDSESFERASAAALRFISYRPRTEAEVRARLSRKFAPQVVEQVLEALRQEQALLDDSVFARLWRDSRESLKPRSASAVKRELVSRGIASDLAAEAVQGMDDDENALRAGLKYLPRLQTADYVTFSRRMAGYLQRRGFGSSTIRRVIDRLWNERKLAGQD